MSLVFVTMLPTNPATHPPTQLPTHPHTHQPTHAPTHSPTHRLSTCARPTNHHEFYFVDYIHQA